MPASMIQKKEETLSVDATKTSDREGQLRQPLT